MLRLSGNATTYPADLPKTGSLPSSAHNLLDIVAELPEEPSLLAPIANSYLEMGCQNVAAQGHE